MGKKGLLLCQFIVLMLVLNSAAFSSQARTFAPITDLEFLIDAFKTQDGHLIEWSLYTREMVQLPTEKSVEEKMMALRNQYPKMEWVLSQDHQTVQLTGTIQHQHFLETVILNTIREDHTRHTYLIYQVSGNSWDEQTANRLASRLNQSITRMYGKNTVIFSCIKGEFNDDSSRELPFYANKFLANLNAIEIESLKEFDFYSISAYTDELSEKLSTKNGEMNIQLALRKNGWDRKTAVVIGTPILTIEY